MKKLTLGLILLMCSSVTLSKSIVKKRYTTYKDISHKDRLLTVSYKGTKNRKTFLSNQMLPIGSAALTSSGALASTGIKGVIHAASGSMTRHQGIFTPSISGVTTSIKNSLRIAKKKGFRSVAIPLIGGGIFLNSIGLTKNELANAIVKTALRNIGGLSLSFIGYSQNDLDIFNQEYNKEIMRQSRLSKIKDKLLLRKSLLSRTNVLRGSITDFQLHKRELIVNAANTELIFGGGLSGYIGRKTQQSSQIDLENQSLINTLKEFYK